MRLIFKPPTIFASPSTEWETWTKIFTLHRFSHFPPGLRLAAGLPVAWQPGKLLRVSRPTFGSRLRKSPRWSSFFFLKNFASEIKAKKQFFDARESGVKTRESRTRERRPPWVVSSSTCAVSRLCAGWWSCHFENHFDSSSRASCVQSFFFQKGQFVRSVLEKKSFSIESSLKDDLIRVKVLPKII